MAETITKSFGEWVAEWTAKQDAMISMLTKMVQSQASTGSEWSRSDSALKIQKVLRGFLVRKSVKKIIAMRREVNEIEKRLLDKEMVELIQSNTKEKLKVDETLTNLLFDSVRGFDSRVKDCWTIIQKAIGLQRKFDAIVSGEETVDISNFAPTEENDNSAGIVISKNVENDSANFVDPEQQRDEIEQGIQNHQLSFVETTTEKEIYDDKNGQNDIYYITDGSKKAVENSPFLEKLKKKGYELLYPVDPFGNYVVQKLVEVCGEEQRTQILLMMTRRELELARICLDMHGTHSVQKLLEHLTTPEQIRERKMDSGNPTILIVSSSEILIHKILNYKSTRKKLYYKPQVEVKCFPAELIMQVAATKEGTYIVDRGLSGDIFLWEVLSGRLLKTWHAYYRAVTCMVFSDDDSLLVSGLEDECSRVWSLLSIELTALDPGEHVFLASGRDGKIYVSALNAKSDTNSKHGLHNTLMVVGSLAAAAHGTALVVSLHYFAKIIHVLKEPPDEQFQQFKELASTIVYIAVGVFASGWIEVSCWILTSERQTAVIRSRYVQMLLNQEMSFFDTYGNNGNIVSQVLSDVLLIPSALSEKVGNYIHNMATFFSGLEIGFANCWLIALITLGTGPFIVAAGGISNIFLHRLAENIQDAYAEAASVAEQAVSYIRTLYAFTNETLAKFSYATSLQATLRYGILISLVQGLGLGFTYGLAICSCALQLWIGRFLVTRGTAHGGQVITALFAVILSGLGLNQAATNFYSFDQGRIAAYRLFEMINRSSSAANQDGTTLATAQGNIEFRNVYFSYLSRPEIPILSGFYLTVPAKKAVALVGRNGSGKSSIIPLMERFYDPTLGEVLLDGENIKNLKLEWLRSQIGLVTQEPALLSLSIRDNIAYGRDATLDQIEEAAKIAHAHSFISSLGYGYETQVGRAGIELTEEQKIKLSIARAVLLNPTILLLDEVTGGLDFEAEKAVQAALDLLMLGRSTIIIARRLSLIRNADYIAVMEEGQLVEMGTHDELLTIDGLYAELLQCEEAAKLPRRMPVRKERSTFQIEKDSAASHSYQEPSSPKIAKSPSLQRVPAVFRPSDGTFNSLESPKVRSPPPEKMVENGQTLEFEKEPSIRRQDSFEMRLPQLPKLDVQSAKKQMINGSDPESPVSPLLTSDPKSERSHSQTFSRPHSHFDDFPNKVRNVKASMHREAPSFWRLAELSFAEWLYAVLGSIGAAIFGSFNPLLAYVISLIVTAYYRREEGHHQRQEIDKWCLIIACMGAVTVVANFLQHFYFGIMGEKMTERVRRMMFSAMLRNEVGWFDEEENSADTLSMRLANDATFVRAAFSNRLSIFIQDSTAVIVAFLIGMLLQWRLAFVALATLPVLTVSAIAQKLWLAGFSRGIQEMHRKASLVLEDAVRNIYTVVAFCAGNKVMELYRLQLTTIFKKSFLHGVAIGCAFGFSQFLLFACNALLLWYTSVSVENGYMALGTALKAYMVFSFATFALVEPFGLAPYILKRRKSLISVFEIIDRVPKIDPDENSAMKPPNVYGSIELKNVDFCYPTRPELLILSNFSLKVNGGQTVAVVGVSGSGKSTIISLIQRFYNPVAGQVLLDGRDLKLYNLRWLRNHLGLIQQEPIIFSTTIRENIIYARHNASEAEMKEAARIANAHHFISSLPHGYDTHVGMRGVDLTQGQKQRIAIARVVLKNAPILLLDEASSSIESESSRVVQEALDTLIMGNKTTILIAHRAAMMRHVDNIVVLNGGRIVEEGTHDSLNAKNGLYVRLMQPHFGKGLRQHRLV